MLDLPACLDALLNLFGIISFNAAGQGCNRNGNANASGLSSVAHLTATHDPRKEVAWRVIETHVTWRSRGSLRCLLCIYRAVYVQVSHDESLGCKGMMLLPKYYALFSHPRGPCAIVLCVCACAHMSTVWSLLAPLQTDLLTCAAVLRQRITLSKIAALSAITTPCLKVLVLGP